MTSAGFLEVCPEDIPGLLDWLTVEHAHDLIGRITAQVRATAADPVLLHQVGTTTDGDDALWIQHQATGLRARFHLPKPGSDRGKVYAKPYNISSIDPANPGPAKAWEQYVGLGVGTRIYQLAAELYPHVRWAGRGQPGALGVRNKLHPSNPYRWQTDCDWCTSHQINWDQADPDAFRGHPGRG